MTEKAHIIYAVSDATGELAISIATGALKQFKEENVVVVRRARTRTSEKILRVIQEALETQGMIVFTLVSQELRAEMIKKSNEAKVLAVDLMGPVLERLTTYLQSNPSDQPGMKYPFSVDYFKRNEAIEFAVKHDDGLGLETIHNADVVLLGISRTSKTPLSVFLAHRGVKAANIPIVRDFPLPREIQQIDSKKIVGLTIDPQKLSRLRQSRLDRMGVTSMKNYAQMEQIREELVYAQRIFARLGPCPVIDVTSKAIEEVAFEVMTTLGL